MPVKVRCPECQKGLSVPDQARGKAVKCPECGSRVPVPGGERAAPAPRGGSAGRRPSQPASERGEAGGGGDLDFLSDLDLSRAEDTRTQVCPKCGRPLDEDTSVCPKCGVDADTGRLTAKAKWLKQRGGPNPDKYYESAVSEAWRFLGKHKKIAIRTTTYHLVCFVLALVCIWLSVWVSKAPLKVFWMLLAVVFGPVIPGWTWFMHTEIIKLTFDRTRKDKVWKHPKFDFFLSTALGLKCFSWLVVFGLPFALIPMIVGVVLYNGGNVAAGLIVAALGFAPVVPLFPIAMSHFSMPVDWPGWLSPKLVPLFFKGLAKPCLHWTGWMLLTMLPTIALTGVAFGVFGGDLAEVYDTMDTNARKAAIERYKPAVERKNQGEAKPLDFTQPDAFAFWFESSEQEMLGMQAYLNAMPEEKKKPAEVEYTKLIAPVVLLVLAVACFGTPAVFNMRTNGWFTHYFRPELNLISMEKEVQYTGRRTGKDGEPEPETRSRGGGGAAAAKAGAGGGGAVVIFIIIKVVLRMLARASGNDTGTE
jgi:hypothetical protein